MSRKVGIIYFYKIMRDQGERFDEFLLIGPRQISLNSKDIMRTSHYRNRAELLSTILQPVLMTLLEMPP